MAECNACGARVSPDELFCGNCGTQQLPNSPELKTVAASLSEDGELHLTTEPEPSAPIAEPSSQPSASIEQSAALAETLEPEPTPISSASLGGSYTDNVQLETNAARGTGGKRAAVKQLDSNTILNHRYEIVRRIGGGGMGAVYLAKDRNLGDAPRAVKEMVESHLDPTQHEKAIGDFKRESLLLTSLEHPSIPTIYDYFYDETLGRFYLVMKYISGGDLASRMRAAIGGKIDEKTVTDWGMQVADVLDYLHSRPKPIIYRDLKPANLMIDGNTGRVMLIDFGIARWVSQQEKGVTAVGTMGYAPPELFSGRVQPASDVYSLGATMFLLLRHPARDAEVDQHHSTTVAVDHQVCRFEVAIDDGLRSRVQIVEHVGHLHTPIGNCLFVKSAADRRTHSRREIAAGDVLHDEIKASQSIVVKVIVDCRD